MYTEIDLERIQKSAVRIILGRNFDNYEDALVKVNLESLKIRSEELCLNFARNVLRMKKQRICSL